MPSHVFVSEVLPYQARMLDMRSQGNEMVNAPVPADFFKEWQRFCENNVRVVFPGYTNDDINADIGFINATFGVKDEVIAKERIERVRRLSYYGDLNRHLSTLRGLAASEKPIDLRSMLSISGHEDVSEFAAFIFSDFMRSKGYDGLIYNEGGERSDQNHTLSYVFYNLQTIGTYDSWHQDDK